MKHVTPIRRPRGGHWFRYSHPIQGRAIVLGGPGGRLVTLMLWEWRAISRGDRTVRVGDTTYVLSDRFAKWTPLLVFDLRRASTDAAYRTVDRHWKVVAA